ncbi:DNA mismatch repair endonuclease MutL [Geomicrobium sp. JCM 19038]|uniref:DNA mismatch repair endonuclease MutL n=1 Tax=Geomicrobium sp. JCM 19038 TaxID=1460635 RepID=UPI00045F280B|nr:DNA mismatch repair endonuclease MutL [Geomicrobium sp. JCM 19038]GAK08953.1 DNA mismatch repair protein MutL [Geomicrobium sp. JCM 19038]
MNTIIQLDEHLSNKIAAGEVVERPASVVKELLENAIDAGSTEIDVAVEEGGLSSIVIIDNGHGVPEDEVELAFLRHATSKIKKESDLHRIETLGFRGEALPSIASVSKLTIETSANGNAGVELTYQGGRLIGRAKAKARQGTKIAVRELFFNTPARLKHVKTINTELGKITDIMNRAALSRPDISFRFTHNQKQMLFTNGRGDLRHVMFAIYGKQVMEKALPIHHETLDYTITGFVIEPEVNRASRHYMSTFINGRYIRHFPLVKAIEQAYYTRLPSHRHPIVVLSIAMDHSLVDVNVHPSKWDVRLSKEEALLKEVTESIERRLARETLIPEQTSNDVIKEKTPVFEETPLPLSYSEKQPVRETVEEPVQSHYEVESIVKQEPNVDVPVERVVAPTPTPQPEPEVKEEQREEEPTERIPPLYPIGQLHGTYILAQNDRGLYMIDQHAAQERIYYEEFHALLYKKNRDVQELLIPFVMEFTNDEIIHIEQLQEDFQSIGLYMEPFGQQAYRVSAHPTWFPKGQEEETIRELTNQALELKKPDVVALREEAAILMSCKAAIKANRHLRNDELLSLIERLRACEEPFTCPHGRNIFVHVTTYELEKMFKRVMN